MRAEIVAELRRALRRELHASCLPLALGVAGERLERRYRARGTRRGASPDHASRDERHAPSGPRLGPRSCASSIEERVRRLAHHRR